MRRIADPQPGEAKTDARDAHAIADAARAMPHTLRAVEPADETVAELEMLTGFDDDLATEATRTKNRLRGLLTQIHPPLEKVVGPRLDHPAVLTLLERFGSPAQLRKAGRRRLVALLRPKAPRMAERLVEDIFTALDEQSVVDKHGAELLFQVLTEREEKNSVAIAYNEAFGKAHMFRPTCARWLRKLTGSVRCRIAVSAPELVGELRGRCDRQFRPG